MGSDRIDKYEFTVSPLYIQESAKTIKLGGRQLVLRDFQERLLDVFKDRSSRQVIYIDAPTGAGKTLSLLIPFFANLESESGYYNGMIGVYPSRELAYDQMASIIGLLEYMGAENLTKQYYGEGEHTRYIRVYGLGEWEIILVYITSVSLDVLKEYFEKQMNKKMNRADVLYEIAKTTWFKYYIVFTVPEYIYLLSTRTYGEYYRAGLKVYGLIKMVRQLLREEYFGKNRGKFVRKIVRAMNSMRRDEIYWDLRRVTELFSMLKAPLFIDEFHLYSGSSLGSFVALLYIYMHERGIGKIIISSATPYKEIIVGTKRKKLDDLIKSMAEIFGYDVVRINAGVSCTSGSGYVQIRKKTRVKAVLVRSNVYGAPAYGVVQRRVRELLGSEDVGWRKDYEEKGRAMIIVDRVATALELEEYVIDEYGDIPLIVTSIKKYSDIVGRKLVTLKEAKIVIGTMAIAYGIDIKGMDLGVIVAKDYMSAMQKIGRIGRGQGRGEAVVYLVLPYNGKLKKLLKKINGKEIPYIKHGKEKYDFIGVLKRIYPRPQPDRLMYWGIGVFKLLTSIYAYIYSYIVMQWKSGLREEFETKNNPREIEVLKNYLEFIDRLSEFLEKNVAKTYIVFTRYKIYLTPESLFSLFSYRNIFSVRVGIVYGDEYIDKDVNLVTLARNMRIIIESGKIYADRVGYYNLYICLAGKGKSVRKFLSTLHKLNGCVVEAKLIGTLIKHYGTNSIRIQQTKDLTSKIIDIIMRIKAPVMILYAENNRNREKILEKMAKTENLLPIYEGRIDRGRCCIDEDDLPVAGLLLL